MTISVLGLGVNISFLSQEQIPSEEYTSWNINLLAFERLIISGRLAIFIQNVWISVFAF